MIHYYFIPFVNCHIEHEFDIESQKQSFLNIQKDLIHSENNPDAQIKYCLSYLVACDSLPLNHLNDQIIYNLIISAIRYGQKNPQIPATQLFPNVSQLSIRNIIINISNQFKSQAIKQFKSFSHVGMVVDSGTIGSFHFVDIYAYKFQNLLKSAVRRN